jgi:two-component system phosphate regulon sensor histidine kinase PhoR
MSIGMSKITGIPDMVSAAGFVQALPDPTLLLDAQGLVLEANQPARDLVATLAVGQPFALGLRAPGLLAAVEQTLADHNSRRAAYETWGNTPRQFEAHVAALGGGEPGSPAILIQIRDLTREQQIERMRADFVANASHELRTPLAALAGFIETLQGAARDDAASRDRFLELMQAQAGRMRRLIDDLLSLSRIEIREHVRPATIVDIAQILRQSADLLAPAAAAAGCPLHLSADGPLNVAGDRDELVQVFHNLIENALKYGASEKGIAISARHNGSEIEVTVSDHGRGIAEAHLPRLTERFYRVSVQDSRQRGGTGLGLAIVKHILNRHGARLAVSSALGQGSTFRVIFPAAS